MNYKHPLSIIGFSFLLILLGCSADSEPAFMTLETPCRQCGEPNLFVSPDGTIYLSWIETINDSTDAFCYSTFQNEKWTSPQEIARGQNWFVNWADFPSLSVIGPWMAAHWLQKVTSGPTIMTSISLKLWTVVGIGAPPLFSPRQHIS